MYMCMCIHTHTRVYIKHLGGVTGKKIPDSICFREFHTKIFIDYSSSLETNKSFYTLSVLYTLSGM